jgi:hypothetical protein
LELIYLIDIIIQKAGKEGHSGTRSIEIIPGICKDLALVSGQKMLPD